MQMYYWFHLQSEKQIKLFFVSYFDDIRHASRFLPLLLC